jgi:hypothetical protein
MGATTFSTRAKGKRATEAFRAAVGAAQHEHGHGGYSGTIAEKDGFIHLDDWREQQALTRRLTLAISEARMPEDRARLEARLAKIKGGDIDAIIAALLDLNDPRIADKCGPAGCFYLGEDVYVFFGWASW